MILAHQLDIFADRLPHKPYCSDDLEHGLIIRGKSHAITKRYIQHNPPPVIAYLIFDLDRTDSAFAWSDANLPAPAWVSVNPNNGHSHISYGLIAPVARTNAARAAPLRLAAAIESAYTDVLDADRGYAGLITKNPLHKDWHTIFPATEAANFGLYDLSYLAEHVSLPSKLPRKSDAIGLGRNVSLFDSIRLWAYSAIRKFWRPGGFNAWQSEVLTKTEQLNVFVEPLPYSEINAISKSVAKWTWQNMTPSGFQEYIKRTHTPEIQAVRGKKGGDRSGQVRAKKANERAIRAIEMQGKGMTQQAIAEKLQVNQSTVARWLKKQLCIKPISDNSPEGGG